MIKNKINEFVTAQLINANVRRITYKLLSIPAAPEKSTLTSRCGRSRRPTGFTYRK